MKKRAPEIANCAAFKAAERFAIDSLFSPLLLLVVRLCDKDTRQKTVVIEREHASHCK